MRRKYERPYLYVFVILVFRPVMKSAAKKDDHTAKGQTGFGPMIKYPGYVDYDHPYFSDPYDKMPTLAMTVGQRSGQNPCPPISVVRINRHVHYKLQ